jgi:hypothetical protein
MLIGIFAAQRRQLCVQPGEPLVRPRQHRRGRTVRPGGGDARRGHLTADRRADHDGRVGGGQPGVLGAKALHPKVRILEHLAVGHHLRVEEPRGVAERILAAAEIAAQEFFDQPLGDVAGADRIGVDDVQFEEAVVDAGRDADLGLQRPDRQGCLPRGQGPRRWIQPMKQLLEAVVVQQGLLDDVGVAIALTDQADALGRASERRLLGDVDLGPSLIDLGKGHHDRRPRKDEQRGDPERESLEAPYAPRLVVDLRNKRPDHLFTPVVALIRRRLRWRRIRLAERSEPALRNAHHIAGHQHAVGPQIPSVDEVGEVEAILAVGAVLPADQGRPVAAREGVQPPTSIMTSSTVRPAR